MDTFGYYPHYAADSDFPSSPPSRPPPASGDSFTSNLVRYPNFIDSLTGKEREEADIFIATLVAEHYCTCNDRRWGRKKKSLERKIRRMEKKVLRLESHPLSWERNGINSIVPIPEVLRSYLQDLREKKAAAKQKCTPNFVPTKSSSSGPKEEVAL